MADPTFINLSLDQDGTSNPLAPIGWVSAYVSTATEYAGFGPTQSIRGEDSFEEGWTHVPASGGAAVVSAVGPFNIPENSTISFSANNGIAHVSIFTPGSFLDNTKATASEVKAVIEAATSLSVDVVGERVLVKPPVFGQSIQLVGISTAAKALGMVTDPRMLLSLGADHKAAVFEFSQNQVTEIFNVGDFLSDLTSFSNALFNTTLVTIEDFEEEHNQVGYTSGLSLPSIRFSNVAEGEVISVKATTNDATEEYTYIAPALGTDALAAAAFASFFNNSALYSSAVAVTSPDRVVLTPALGTPITLTISSVGTSSATIGAENALINCSASLYGGSPIETFVPGWKNEPASDPDEFIINFNDWTLHAEATTFSPTSTYIATITMVLDGNEVDKSFTVVNPSSVGDLVTQMAATMDLDPDIVTLASGPKVLWGTAVSSTIILDVVTNHVALIPGTAPSTVPSTISVPHDTAIGFELFTNDGVSGTSFVIETFERDPVSAATQGPNVPYQIAVSVDTAAIGVYSITVNTVSFSYNAVSIQSLGFIAGKLRDQINLQGHLVDVEASPVDPTDITRVGIRSTNTPITPIDDIAITVAAPSNGLTIIDPDVLQQINWTWNSQLTTL